MIRPILKLSADGKPFFLRIDSAIYLTNPFTSAQREVMDATDLTTANVCCVEANAFLKNALNEAYPNCGYVTREFEIRKFPLQGDKRYFKFSIIEIKMTKSAGTIPGLHPVPADTGKFLDDRSPQYLEYLRSTLWKNIRKRILKRDGSACRRCGGKATEVHHRSYSEAVLAGNDDAQLASICEGCHNIVTFDDSGARRSPDETDRLLLLRDESATFPVPKVDLRRTKRRENPPEWDRMSAVQRAAWHHEYQRIKLLRWLKRGDAPKTIRRLLNGYGMDDNAIDLALAGLRTPKSSKSL
ncbi:MAG: hypothetical protein WCF30_00665 [Terracidiphilus sp.]